MIGTRWERRKRTACAEAIGELSLVGIQQRFYTPVKPFLYLALRARRKASPKLPVPVASARGYKVATSQYFGSCQVGYACVGQKTIEQTKIAVCLVERFACATLQSCLASRVQLVEVGDESRNALIGLRVHSLGISFFFLAYSSVAQCCSPSVRSRKLAASSPIASAA